MFLLTPETIQPLIFLTFFSSILVLEFENFQKLCKKKRRKGYGQCQRIYNENQGLEMKLCLCNCQIWVTITFSHLSLSFVASLSLFPLVDGSNVPPEDATANEWERIMALRACDIVHCYYMYEQFLFSIKKAKSKSLRCFHVYLRQPNQ